MDCQHCDEYGFCKLYSNETTVWKCAEDPDCKDYVEAEDGR